MALIAPKTSRNYCYTILFRSRENGVKFEKKQFVNDHWIKRPNPVSYQERSIKIRNFVLPDKLLLHSGDLQDKYKL